KPGADGRRCPSPGLSSTQNRLGSPERKRIRYPEPDPDRNEKCDAGKVFVGRVDEVPFPLAVTNRDLDPIACRTPASHSAGPGRQLDGVTSCGGARDTST